MSAVIGNFVGEERSDARCHPGMVHQHQTRNLEIPGSLVSLAPRNDARRETRITSRSLSSGALCADPLARNDGVQANSKISASTASVAPAAAWIFLTVPSR